MKITIELQDGYPYLSETYASVSGDILTVNDVPYDLSDIPEGGVGSPEGVDHPFTGEVSRIDGELRFGLRWVYHGPEVIEDQPKGPIIVTITSGAIDCPVIRNPEPEVEPDDV